MTPEESDDLRMLRFQYKAVFEVEIEETLLRNERQACLCITYGKLGYDQQRSLQLAYNHIRMQRYNFLLTDEIIFLMLKKSL